MSMNGMAELRASFFVECEELMEALQDGLATLDSGDYDDETINVCFRAVHSIKGGAGAFGLSELVNFAHVFESVMDCLRSKTMSATQDVVQLLFRSADVLSDLVSAARDGNEHDVQAVESLSAELSATANPNGVPEEEEPEELDFAPAPLSLDLDFGDDEDDDGDPAAEKLVWRIIFKPLSALYTSGSEPLHLIRAVGELGQITTEADLDAVPTLEDLEPETAHIWWTIHLDSPATESEIREIFDFVEGLCDLSLEQVSISDEQDAAPPTNSASGGRITLSDTASGPEAPPAQATSEPEPIPELAESTPPSNPTEPTAQTASKPTPPEPKGGAEGAARQGTAVKATVRVDLDRIDRLVNLVGELVINQAMLSQSVVSSGLPPNSAVTQGLDEFLQLTRDIQDSVMMIRAQPVKSLFQRMSRIVREASQSVGKTVRLVTVGDSTEVDKTVIERLADPLTHMIRNAVDHGLESTDDRVASGKPAQGTVTLTAAHRSGRVIIEIADDGGGINRQKVKEIAVSKGLVPPDAQLSDSEIDNLIFLPGFSTAKEVTDLSGRGVGMDVVRSAIQMLSGRVSISSVPGEGTTFSISLPLTLAVLDGMIVRAAGETLVVPLAAIHETLSLEDTEIRRLGPETNVLHVRESFVPLLDLGAELGFRDPLDSYDTHVVLLIAQENGARAALIVDAIEEQRQVVIKGLQDSYGHVQGIAAATILGDGQVALILDPIDLMAHATGRTRQNTGFELAG